MPVLDLKNIAEIVDGELKGNPAQLIRLLEIDSRRINLAPDSLFVAIKGIRHNGHEYIPELIRKGFTNFLVNKGSIDRNKYKNVNFVFVPETLHAMQLLAGHARKQLKGQVIGVTGSNGKTVVKEWLFQCLSLQNKVSRSPKSYNSQVGVPLSIWLLNPTADWSIVEAGISQPGEMQKLESIIQPDIGIITNIGQAHQENFNSLEQKVYEKLLLFQRVKKLFYCLDHNLIADTVRADENLKKKELITWSMKDPKADLYIEHMQQGKQGTHVEFIFKKKKHKLKFPYSDQASIENCIHITLLLMNFQFQHSAIQHGLSSLSPVAMRLEQVRGINGCTIINDSYNSDINSLRIALDFQALQKQHKNRCLILSELRQTGMSGKELINEIVSLLNSYKIDQLLFVGEEFTKYPDLPARSRTYNTTEELISVVSSVIQPDSAVLIKGAREYEFEKITNALSEKKHTTVLEINFNHLVSNLNYFRSLLQPDTKIMVMVKALSYGSGSHEIANLLQHEKVDYLGVAFTDEGIELRKNGISLPIMVMSPDPESYDKIIEYNLEPEIYNFRGLSTFARIVSANQLPDYPIHIKIDTGMHRLGFLPEEIPELLKQLSGFNNIRIKAIFSHLAASDIPGEDDFTQFQIEQFSTTSQKFSEALNFTPVRHILNSAGIERFPEAQFDMVRLGIGLHGYSGTNKKLMEVSTLKSSIAQIKTLNKGETVGYNRREKLQRNSQVAIIPVGYADGLDRKLGNRNGYVLVGNKKAPYIGDICMDLCMIDITDMSVNEGDEVIIFGPKIPVYTLAQQVNTIPYEILTNVSARVKRKYIHE